MPTRLVVTERWTNDVWFGALPLRLKMFYTYLCDRCDCAGVWEPNWRSVDFEIGEHFDPESTFEALRPKVKLLASGKWFIVRFIFTQYHVEIDDLNPDKSTTHRGVVRRLREEGLWKRAESGAESFDYDAAFKEVWEMYPAIRRKNRSISLMKWAQSVKGAADAAACKATLTYYLGTLRVEDAGKYAERAEDFFSRWTEMREVATQEMTVVDEKKTHREALEKQAAEMDRKYQEGQNAKK